MRGGSVQKGFECGSFYIRIASGNSYIGWDYGVCLSFKPYETFYCDYFYQGNGTHYLMHGGRSSNGANCGALSVNASVATSVTGWHYGACISFKK